MLPVVKHCLKNSQRDILGHSLEEKKSLKFKIFIICFIISIVELFLHNAIIPLLIVDGFEYHSSVSVIRNLFLPIKSELRSCLLLSEAV